MTVHNLEFFSEDLIKNKIYFHICRGKTVNIHTHSFLELAYVLEGEAKHILDGNITEIKKGDYFVIDYNSRHSYRATSEKFIIINCLFLPEFIDASLIHCNSLDKVISNYQIHMRRDFFTSNPSSSIFRDADGTVRRLITHMNSEYKEKKPGYLQIIRSELIMLLVTTMRKIYFEPHRCEHAMEKAIEYINRNYMNPISLSDVAAVCGYSVPYLSLRFKSYMGMNYKNYLQKVRIEQSMRLLSETDTEITDIVQKCGYHDTKAFYEAFKKHSGTTPLKFRKGLNL